jgi:hypothetical protein
MGDREEKLNVLEILIETFNKEFSKAAVNLMLDALEPIRIEDIKEVLPKLLRDRQFFPTVADIADAVSDLEDQGGGFMNKIRSKYFNTFDFNETVTQARLDDMLVQMRMEPGSVGAREL